MSGKALLEAESTEIFRQELQSAMGAVRAGRLVVQNVRFAANTIDEFPVGLGKTVRIRTICLGRQFSGTNGAVGDSGSWEFVGTFKNIGGTVTQVGTTTDLIQHRNNSDVAMRYFTDGYKVYVQALFNGATDSLGLDYVFTTYTYIHELNGI
jgi:hypothetical protein